MISRNSQSLKIISHSTYISNGGKGNICFRKEHQDRANPTDASNVKQCRQVVEGTILSISRKVQPFPAHGVQVLNVGVLHLIDGHRNVGDAQRWFVVPHRLDSVRLEEGAREVMVREEHIICVGEKPIGIGNDAPSWPMRKWAKIIGDGCRSKLNFSLGRFVNLKER